MGEGRGNGALRHSLPIRFICNCNLDSDRMEFNVKTRRKRMLSASFGTTGWIRTSSLQSRSPQAGGRKKLDHTGIRLLMYPPRRPFSYSKMHPSKVSGLGDPLHRSGARGKDTRTVNRSATVSTVSVPPQASVKLRAMDRPSPLPPSVRLASPRTNRAVKSTSAGSSCREVLRRLASALPCSAFRVR